MNLFDTGIRPAIDEYLAEKAKEKRDYGDYWSASSAGYCMRLVIMRRLGIPKVPELEDNATQTRIFEAGHIFHEWLQRITKNAGLSIASEVELQDEHLMIRGHFDDLVLVGDDFSSLGSVVSDEVETITIDEDDIKVTNYTHEQAHIRKNLFGIGQTVKTFASPEPRLILYDYKTAHSASFNYKKKQTEIGHYHKMQLGTYMYMLRRQDKPLAGTNDFVDTKDLSEARILSISKDDLRMDEKQLLWTPALKREVEAYWNTLNKYWEERKLPPCTCLEHDGGFMGRRSKKGKIYNDFYYNDEPCSLEWYNLSKENK